MGEDTILFVKFQWYLLLAYRNKQNSWTDGRRNKKNHVTDAVDCYGKVQANDFYVMQVTLTKLITVYVPIGARD